MSDDGQSQLGIYRNRPCFQLHGFFMLCILVICGYCIYQGLHDAGAY